MMSKILEILDDILGLAGRSAEWDYKTELFGNVPELTSQSAVELLLALEEEFGIIFADDEMDADALATVGSLVKVVEAKLAQQASAT